MQRWFVIAALATAVCASTDCLAELRDIAVLPLVNASLYNETQRVNNPFFNRRAAPFVVLPRTTDDVARSLKCAYDNNLRVALKAGGHGFNGASAVGVDGAFTIAFANMSSITLLNATLPDGSVVPAATVQAGVRWEEVYAAVDSHGLVAVGGLCPSVGVIGHFQGGGVGAMGRAAGLASDNVLSVTMVTANGSDVLTANATHNTDLFFALRGAGGSNYGAVVDVTLRLHPAPADGFTWSLLCYSGNEVSSAAVLTAVAGIVNAGLPNNTNIDVIIAPAGADGSTPASVCVWAIAQGDAAYSNRTLAPLLPPALHPLPNASSVKSYNSFYPMISDYAIAHGYSEFSDEAYGSRNCLVSAASLAANASALIAATTALVAAAPPSCSLHWIQFGGVIATAAAPNATAFPWRDAAYMSYAVCGFVDAPSYTVADAYLNDYAAATAPFCDGSYVNFMDFSQTRQGFGLQYYGDNLPRLQAIKAAWAPAGATPLRFPQEIGPNAGQL